MGYLVDPQIIDYACGANSGADLDTPMSAWPYDCNNYVNKDADDNYSDGVVAIVRFPYCWDGHAHFPAPNSPVGAPVMVPGYVAPWIPYTAWQHYGLAQQPANDFAYPDSNGNCNLSGKFPIQVVQLEERIHMLTYGTNWGDPSSCTGDTNLNWNSIDNAENSTVQSPDRDATADGSTTSDATVQISTGVWGPFKCQSVQAPNPKSGATTLSFACSHGGDPNCKIGLSTPQTCAGGTCYVGAYQPNLTKPFYGWETLHADYWQTWQEASNNNGNLDNVLSNNPPTDGVAGDIGTFGDVVEDCTSGGTGSGKCVPAFIVSGQNSPVQVYGGD